MKSIVLAVVVLCVAVCANPCLHGGTEVHTLVSRNVTQPSNETMARVAPITFGAYNWIVIAGGRELVDRSDPTVKYYSLVSLYDIATGTTTSIGSMSAPRCSEFDASINGVVNEHTGTMIIAGGEGPHDTYLKTVEVYNFFTNRWSTSSLSALPSEGVQCFLVGGHFYVLLQGAKTLDRLDGATGKWLGSFNVGYPPGAGFATLQSGAAVGEMIYVTTGGVNGQDGIQAMITFNTTNNQTNVIYVPLPGWCCELDFMNPLAFGTDLLFVNAGGGIAFVYHTSTNTTNSSIPIPLLTHPGYSTRAIAGSSKAMYYYEDYPPPQRPMVQYIAASTSFAVMDDPFLPYRIETGRSYNARFGIFAIVDGAPYNSPGVHGLNAVNLYQESTMQMPTMLEVNQTDCICSATHSGFLCSKTSGASSTHVVSLGHSVMIAAATLVLTFV